MNLILLETLSLLLEDWRFEINRAYARRDASTDDLEIRIHEREVQRRLVTIKTMEKLIAQLKGETK